MKPVTTFVLLAPVAYLVRPVQAQKAVLPNVRSLEYRAVTLTAPKAQMPRAHLWLVRSAKDETRRGIGWDGVQYEVQTVGARASWRADVEAFFKPRAKNQPLIMPQPFTFVPAPVALQFLKTLGAADLVAKTQHSHAYGLSRSASEAWKANLRDAGVRAFVQGDFADAKRSLQTLLQVLPAQTANPYSARSEAQQILADIARREHETSRPQAEIAALIWDLQNVRAHQWSSPGDLSWTSEATIQKLIDKGDAAVEPLLNTLETDNRLTLSMRESRGEWGRPGTLGTVREAAQNTLEILLKHPYSGPSDWRLSPSQRNAAVVREMRADWAKLKGNSPVDRLFQTLSRPGQTPQRLEEAARELIRIGKPYFPTTIVMELKDGKYQPLKTPPRFFGEPLRDRRNPSVSDLLIARMDELSARALKGKQTPNALDPTLPISPDTPDAYELNRAMAASNSLAWVLSRWDAQRAAPLLAAQLENTKQYTASVPRGIREDAVNALNHARRQFLTARLKTPFRSEAMREYSAFLESQPFGRLSAENYAPLWQHPDEPALQEAAQALFGTPQKPFQEAAQWKTRAFEYDTAFRLLQSPLIKMPLFKAAVLRELSNETVVATLRKLKSKEGEVKVTAWDWSGQNVNLSRPQLENGASQPLRVCDLVAFWLGRNRPDKMGNDRIYPMLDVSLPTQQRDAQLRAVKSKEITKAVADESGFKDFTLDLP